MANSHTRAQCEFIVRKLAAFEPPRSIVIDFCAQFPGTKCDENDVKRLDRESGAVLSPDLHMLFMSTREAVMLDPGSAPYSEQKARLIALSNDVKFLRGNNQLADSHKVLRQIAEEQGIIGGKGAAKGASGEPKDLLPIGGITRRFVNPPEPPAVTE